MTRPLVSEKSVPFCELEFVFVVTFGRSGSTVLAKVLNSIDGWCIRGENHNTLFNMSQGVASMNRAASMFPYRLPGPDSPWSGLEVHNRQGLARSVAEAFVDNVLAPPPGTRVVGFKEIRHTPDEMTGDQFAAYIDFLLSAFPRSKIVFNTRAPETTAESGWWADCDRDYVINSLNQSISWFRKAEERHPDNCFAISHEEMLKGADGFSALFDFLGARPDPEILGRLVRRRFSISTKYLKGPASGTRKQPHRLPQSSLA